LACKIRPDFHAQTQQSGARGSAKIDTTHAHKRAFSTGDFDGRMCGATL
jgi:hypothetical protein